MSAHGEPRLGRSILHAMRHALQWRLLLLSPVVLFAASIATYIPLRAFLGDLLDYSPRWKELSASLDSSAMIGILKQLQSRASMGIASGVETSMVLGVLAAPLLAGAALFVAEREEHPKIASLLSGAGSYYWKLFRMELVAIIPLGVASGIAGGLSGWAASVASKATTEESTHTSSRIGIAVSVVAFLLAQLFVDAGRARLASDPTRKSAFYALGAGIKLVAKKPGRTLAITAVTTVLAMVLSAVILIARQQITQSGSGTMLVAFLLSQLAVVPIAWAHAAKLTMLVETARTVEGTLPDPPVHSKPIIVEPPPKPAVVEEAKVEEAKVEEPKPEDPKPGES